MTTEDNVLDLMAHAVSDRLTIEQVSEAVHRYIAANNLDLQKIGEEADKAVNGDQESHRRMLLLTYYACRSLN
jgi:hypothetical protein